MCWCNQTSDIRNANPGTGSPNPFIPLGSNKLAPGASCAAIKATETPAAPTPTKAYWVIDSKTKKATIVYCDMYAFWFFLCGLFLGGGVCMGCTNSAD